jgi:hypothetical protein
VLAALTIGVLAILGLIDNVGFLDIEGGLGFGFDFADGGSGGCCTAAAAVEIPFAAVLPGPSARTSNGGDFGTIESVSLLTGSCNKSFR